MKIILKIISNVLGLFLGVIASIVAGAITSVLFDLILRIPFLVSILSYPSTPDLYVSTGIMYTSVAAGFAVCQKISLPSRKGYKIGTIVLGILYIILALMNIYTIIFVTEFTWSGFVPQTVLIGGGLIVITSSEE